MRYAAFISYTHRDRPSAEWLHRRIEGYRPPQDLNLGAGAAALRPVFLDRAELPSSSDLAATVRTALEQSDALVVVCSLAAAQSRWVNEEVRFFKSLGRSARIFCLVVDGDLGSGAAFVPALRFEVEDGVITQRPAPEPLAADLRPGGDDRAAASLKIIAGLLGVPLDRLRQREHARRQRRLAIVATASAIGCAAFAAISVVALHARAEADRQRIAAQHEALTARRTAEFMKSLFAVSDPGEARGNSITAREVLDRGARQIQTQLKDTPLVRADLATTLGEVYAGLGLYKDSLQLLDYAAQTPQRPPELRAHTDIAIAELQVQRGEYPAALKVLSDATQALKEGAASDDALRMRVMAAFGDLYWSTDEPQRARDYFVQLLKLASRPSVNDAPMRIRALQGIADVDLDAGKFEPAAAGFTKALSEQLALTGELHPRVSELLNELGGLEYLRGNRDAAIAYYRRCLAIEQQIFTAGHPSTAGTQQNLARILLEERDFPGAGALLEEALAAVTANVEEGSDGMAFFLSNLALVRMGQGRVGEAEPLFHKALDAAVLNKSRLHGPILTDLADLECRSGRNEAGLARLAEARPIVAARYPDDPWRVAHVDEVRAGCLTHLKRYAEAEALVSSSMPVLLPHWPANTLYGYDALQRAGQLYRLTGDAEKLAHIRRLALAGTASSR
jgi:tetratricopeptide (TPR) repeat protein